MGGDVGVGLGVRCVQQGPVHDVNFLRSFEDLSCEHLTWIQPLQVLHSTHVVMILFVHTAQNQAGPGFCSIPAISKSSRIRHAGLVLLFVEHTKNSS